MRKEKFRFSQGCRWSNLANGNQREAQPNCGYCGGNSHMGHLAQPARRFILAVGVPVRCYLQQKQKRQHRQRERQRLCEPAPAWIGSTLHYSHSILYCWLSPGPRSAPYSARQTSTSVSAKMHSIANKFHRCESPEPVRQRPLDRHDKTLKNAGR
jgi:hypothetical protein